MKTLEQQWLLMLKNGIFSISLDHFLAMFPASILVPVLINNQFGENLIDIPLVLIANAIGTVLFAAITKGKLPAYLGSSFAYIGLTIYLINNYVNEGISPYLAYSYVLWAYLFAAVIMGVLSFIYQYNISKKIMGFLFPSAIIGPVISLIGLELADVGASDAGFDAVLGSVDLKASVIAIITLLIIVFASVTRRSFLKNSSIVIGVVAGYILSAYFLNLDLSFSGISVFQLPKFSFFFMTLPPDALQLFLAVLPATIVIFTENISRVTIINSLKRADEQKVEISDKENNENFLTSLRGHAASIGLSAAVGSVPTTIYAENIAVMSINYNDANMKHKSFDPFSVVPYLFAAVMSVMVSFIGPLQHLLMNIPKPVIGGVELFLFGIITAPGIQMLVDKRVNYKKISNQILTAGVLVAGVGGFSLNFGMIEVKGMSLGLVIGVILNIMFRALGFFGILNEHLSFDEVKNLCMEKNREAKQIVSEGRNKIEIADSQNNVFAVIEKGETNTYLSLRMAGQDIDKWCTIYDDVMDVSDHKGTDGCIKITIASKIPNRHLRSMVDQAFLFSADTASVLTGV